MVAAFLWPIQILQVSDWEHGCRSQTGFQAMGAATAIQVNLLAFSEEFDLDHQDEPERTNIIEKKGKHRSYSNRGPAGKSTKISCSCIFRFPSQKIQKGRAEATGKRNCTQDLSVSKRSEQSSF